MDTLKPRWEDDENHLRYHRARAEIRAFAYDDSIVYAADLAEQNFERDFADDLREPITEDEADE